MELFIIVSAIGTLVLLAVHMVYFACGSRELPMIKQYQLPPDASAPTAALKGPPEPGVHYHRAA